MSTQIKKNGNWVTVAGGTRMWVGTKAALQAALDAGELVDGTAVMVTDDYEEEGGKKYMQVPDWANTSQVVNSVTVDTEAPNWDTVYTATAPCFITMSANPDYDNPGSLRISGKAAIVVSRSGNGQFTYTGLLNTGDTVEVQGGDDSNAVNNIRIFATPLKLVEVD